ncbi:hypothetical protein Vafri_15820 [Volvox africanus]|uniref:Uncharacterized protein n=1 Tax=Volvox africanus TaxID=51714 RepID=A0A8J4BG41_9CHLO|nr:hypothetical protein Vafri_15820 [Volvox africanus]
MMNLGRIIDNALELAETLLATDFTGDYLKPARQPFVFAAAAPTATEITQQPAADAPVRAATPSRSGAAVQAARAVCERLSCALAATEAARISTQIANLKLTNTPPHPRQPPSVQHQPPLLTSRSGHLTSRELRFYAAEASPIRAPAVFHAGAASVNLTASSATSAGSSGSMTSRGPRISPFATLTIPAAGPAAGSSGATTERPSPLRPLLTSRPSRLGVIPSLMLHGTSLPPTTLHLQSHQQQPPAAGNPQQQQQQQLREHHQHYHAQLQSQPQLQEQLQNQFHDQPVETQSEQQQQYPSPHPHPPLSSVASAGGNNNVVPAVVPKLSLPLPHRHHHHHYHPAANLNPNLNASEPADPTAVTVSEPPTATIIATTKTPGPALVTAGGSSADSNHHADGMGMGRKSPTAPSPKSKALGSTFLSSEGQVAALQAVGPSPAVAAPTLSNGSSTSRRLGGPIPSPQYSRTAVAASTAAAAPKTVAIALKLPLSPVKVAAATGVLPPGDRSVLAAGLPPRGSSVASGKGEKGISRVAKGVAVKPTGMVPTLRLPLEDGAMAAGSAAAQIGPPGLWRGRQSYEARRESGGRAGDGSEDGGSVVMEAGGAMAGAGAGGTGTGLALGGGEERRPTQRQAVVPSLRLGRSPYRKGF